MAPTGIPFDAKLVGKFCIYNTNLSDLTILKMVQEILPDFLTGIVSMRKENLYLYDSFKLMLDIIVNGHILTMIARYPGQNIYLRVFIYENNDY